MSETALFFTLRFMSLACFISQDGNASLQLFLYVLAVALVHTGDFNKALSHSVVTYAVRCVSGGFQGEEWQTNSHASEEVSGTDTLHYFIILFVYS